MSPVAVCRRKAVDELKFKQAVNRCKITEFSVILQAKKHYLRMDSLNKKFYKIGEVAEMLRVPQSTLRFWEKQFTVIHPTRNDRGTRFYTPADIDKIAQIHYLVKFRGMKLDAAQEELRRNPEGVSRQNRAVRRLYSIRERLESLLRSLDSLR